MSKIFFPIKEDDLFIGITVHLVIVLGLLLALLIIKCIKRLDLYLYTQLVIFSTAYTVHGFLFFLLYPHISLPVWLILCMVLWKYPSNAIIINSYYRGAVKSIESSKRLNKTDGDIASYISKPVHLQAGTISQKLKIAADMILSRKKGKIKLKRFPPLSILFIGVVVPSIYCSFFASMYEEFNSLYFSLFENYVGLTGLTYIFSLLTKYGGLENTHSRYYQDPFIKYVLWLFALILYIGSTVMIVNAFQRQS